MARTIFSDLISYTRFAPDSAPAHQHSAIRNAKHNAPLFWMRIPVICLISVWLLVFVGVWPWAIWLVATLSVESLASYCRGRLLAGDLSWAKWHVATLAGLSLCWIVMSGLVWRFGGEIGRVAAIMGLLSIAVYGVFGEYKDRAILIVLTAPPLLALLAFMGIDLALHQTPMIAVLGTISTSATVCILGVLGYAVHKSDQTAHRANVELGSLVDTLSETQSTLESASKIARIGWWRYDFETDKLIWSDSLREIFGVDPDYVPTSQFAQDFYAPKDLEIVAAKMATAINERSGWTIAAPIKTMDGRKVWIRGIASVISEGDTPKKIIGAVQDITNEKRLQDDLIEAQKFEALGRVIAHLSHDLNNSLTTVVGAADSLALNVAGNARAAERITTIHLAARRAGDIYNNLITYARMQVLAPQVVSINDLVMETAREIESVRLEALRIELDLDERRPAAYVDPTLFRSALLNIASNAHEAMEGSGAVFFTTRIVDSPEAPSHESAPRRVIVDIKDTGPGIPDALRTKIFDPFFTTREDESRHGLGLSVARGFALQSGGDLTVENTTTGAHFRLSLPLAAGDAKHAHSSPSFSPVRHILLVEDDALVRDALTFALREAGFEVVSASSGESAITLVKRLTPVDVVLTDIVLEGGMSGPEAAARIRELRPEARIVFMSGYASDKLGDLHALDADYLRKPFALDEFRRLVGAERPADRPAA